MAYEAAAWIASFFVEGGVTAAEVATYTGVSAGAANAAVGLATTAYGASQQQMAGGEQRKALREQQRIAEIRSQREIRDQVRQERIKRATILQSGENVGAAESSGALGGAGSVTSQAASNISFLDQIGAASARSNIFQTKAVDFAESASIFKGVGSFASTFAGPEGYRSLGKSIYGQPKKSIFDTEIVGGELGW